MSQAQAASETGAEGGGATATDIVALESPELLMSRFRRGDARGLAWLMTTFKGPMVDYFHRMTGDRHRAEDLAQEVFLRLLKSAATYTDGRPFTPWIYAIARNILIDWLRQPGRRLTIGMPPVDPANTREPGPKASALALEREDAVRAAIADLPEPYREAVVLRDLQGLTYEEVAKVLETSVKTVSSRLARGRTLLAKRLRPVRASTTGG